MGGHKRTPSHSIVLHPMPRSRLHNAVCVRFHSLRRRPAVSVERSTRMRGDVPRARRNIHEGRDCKLLTSSAKDATPTAACKRAHRRMPAVSCCGAAFSTPLRAPASPEYEHVCVTLPRRTKRRHDLDITVAKISTSLGQHALPLPRPSAFQAVVGRRIWVFWVE